jgi:hypothetical protein
MTEDRHSPTAEVVTGVAGVLTVGGILTFALFPFLLPILLLTGVFVLPLLAPLVLLIPVALIAVAIRALSHRRQRPIGSETHGRGEPAVARPRAQKHAFRHGHVA